MNNLKNIFPIFICLVASPIFTFSQKTNAILYFKDGKEKRGLAKLKNNGQIKFRLNKNEKAIKYNFEDFKKVKIYNGDEVIFYTQIDIKGKKKPKIVQQIITGQISLYGSIVSGYNPGFGGAGFGNNNGFNSSGIGYSYSINNLYVKRKEEKEAVHLGSNQLFTKNFIDATSKFFSDCPDLVEKIVEKEYKRKNIKEIVEYYNKNCGINE